MREATIERNAGSLLVAALVSGGALAACLIMGPEPAFAAMLRTGPIGTMAVCSILAVSLALTAVVGVIGMMQGMDRLLGLAEKAIAGRWETAGRFQNEMRTTDGARIGTLTFVMERNRAGERRYRVEDPDAIGGRLVDMAVGNFHARRWVREGVLPA